MEKQILVSSSYENVYERGSIMWEYQCGILSGVQNIDTK